MEHVLFHRLHRIGQALSQAGHELVGLADDLDSLHRESPFPFTPNSPAAVSNQSSPSPSISANSACWSQVRHKCCLEIRFVLQGITIREQVMAGQLLSSNDQAVAEIFPSHVRLSRLVSRIDETLKEHGLGGFDGERFYVTFPGVGKLWKLQYDTDLMDVLSLTWSNSINPTIVMVWPRGSTSSPRSKALLIKLDSYREDITEDELLPDLAPLPTGRPSSNTPSVKETADTGRARVDGASNPTGPSNAHH